MEPLGKDARRLLQLAKGSHEPPMAAKTRLRARLDARLAATALSSTTGLLGKTALAHAALPAMKLLYVALPAAKSVFVSLVLVGAVGVGYVVAPAIRPSTVTGGVLSAASSRPPTPVRMKRLATGEPSTRPPPAASSPEVSVEVTATPPLQAPARGPIHSVPRGLPAVPQELAQQPVEGEPVEEKPIEAAVPIAPRQEGSLQANSEWPPSDPLSEETRLIRQAHQAILKGHPTAALAYLAEHQRKFARGALQKEREAARIVANCKLSRMQEAQASWAQFTSAWPNSPLGARVRASCHWDAER